MLETTRINIYLSCTHNELYYAFLYIKSSETYVPVHFVCLYFIPIQICHEGEGVCTCGWQGYLMCYWNKCSCQLKYHLRCVVISDPVWSTLFVCIDSPGRPMLISPRVVTLKNLCSHSGTCSMLWQINNWNYSHSYWPTVTHPLSLIIKG